MPIGATYLRRAIYSIRPKYMLGLKLIEFVPRNGPVGCPHAWYYSDERIIRIFSVPLQWELPGPIRPHHREMGYLGARVSQSGGGCLVEWSDQDGLSFWIFIRVLLHELGHHHAFMRSRVRLNVRRETRHTNEFMAEFFARRIRAELRQRARMRRAARGGETED